MNIDEILSADTAKLALQRWRTFLVVMGLSLSIGVVTYLLLPRKYSITADIIGTRYENDITPNNQTNAFSAAALLGGNTNDLPNINDFKLYTQLLTSPELGATVVDNPVMHTIFKNMWHNDHWEQPDTPLSHLMGFISKLAGQKPWVPPDGFTVARYVKANMTIVANKDAKLLTLNTWNSDPDVGKAFITLISGRADDMVKEMAQKRFEAKVQFLENALASANVEETRMALGQALAKAETDKIYSESTLPFAAEFLAPPATPARPQFPQFSITMWIFAGLGVVAYVFDLFFVMRTGQSLKKSMFNKLSSKKPVAEFGVDERNRKDSNMPRDTRA
jgi:uncharacterized protein involved in exopolysaccharide biosynthesis